jgi:hypothetical protein
VERSGSKIGHMKQVVLMVLALAAVVLVAQAQAQALTRPGANGTASAPGGAPVSPLDPLYACTRITDAAERLACFDGAVAQLRAREQSRDVVAVDRAAVEQVRRESFGFNLPSLPNLFARREPAAGAAAAGAAGDGARAAPAEPEEFEERQVMQVTSLRMAGDRQVLVMANGQTWQFAEPGTLTPARRAPFNVLIRRAALGSYILSVEGSNRGHRVRRVE